MTLSPFFKDRLPWVILSLFYHRRIFYLIQLLLEQKTRYSETKRTKMIQRYSRHHPATVIHGSFASHLPNQGPAAIFHVAIELLRGGTIWGGE